MTFNAPTIQQRTALDRGVAQPSVLATGAAAAAVAWLLYHFIFAPLATAPWGAFFTDRGVSQPTIVFFGLWSLFILLWKLASIVRQQAATKATYAEIVLPDVVCPRTAAELQLELARLPPLTHSSHVVRRLQVALQAFRQRRSPAAIGDVLREEAVSDQQLVDRSLSHVRLLGWALPLTGMIGTLFGLGQAVSGLAAAFAKAVDLPALQAAMPSLTGGLGTAFDVTLLGLVMCVFVMVPATWLAQVEEGLLGDADKFCRRELMPRIAGEEDAVATRIRDAVVEGWSVANAEIQNLVANQARAWAEQQEALATKFAEELTRISTGIACAAQAPLEPVVVELRELRGTLTNQLSSTLRAMDATSKEVVSTMVAGVAESGNALGASLAAPVQAVVESLSSALDKHVVALGRIDDGVRAPAVAAIQTMESMMATLRVDLPHVLSQHREKMVACAEATKRLLELREAFVADAEKLQGATAWVADVRGLGGSIRRLEQRVSAVLDKINVGGMPQRRVS